MNPGIALEFHQCIKEVLRSYNAELYIILDCSDSPVNVDLTW